MAKFFKGLYAKLNTTLGFFFLMTALFWLKTYIAYRTKFTLGVESPIQQFILALNPLPTALLLFGIALYFRGKLSYWLMLIIDALQTTWLFANILYYREFSDFLSIGIVKGSGSVDNNLGKSLAGILHFSDLFVYLDVLVLIVLLLTKLIKVDKRPLKKRFAITMTVFSIALMMVDYGLSVKDRSGLLTRTFDNNYIVKYLGLNEYAAFNAYQTHQQSTSRSQASKADMKSVQKYLKNNPAGENFQYFGKEQGKNVFVFHLESFQQFLINYKYKGQEVTPNINAFYKDQNTLSFDNFFHQVAQGKTSDAEMMMENSLYGLPTGSAMISYGTSNTFQAAPAILSQHGYTTAAMHGDVPSFWNRGNTYKSWGYQNFFSKSFYPNADKPSYNVGYGLKDKIFLKDSAKYIQQLPQPFYAKVISVTNHYPYLLGKKDSSFPQTDTGDNTVDGYVVTAHYLDQAFGEFINYLKKVNLYDNSMIVVYGDHYGISNNHRPAIAKLLGKKKVTNYDLAMFQKVPFMIHAPGVQGGVNHTYGGEIDALPTMMDLLGIKTTGNYIMMGQDLLSTQRNQIVPFRDGNFVTPQYTKVGSQVYDTATGKLLDLTASQKKQVTSDQDHVNTVLGLSDKIMTRDLLRFYTPTGFKKVNKSDYNYSVSSTNSRLKQGQKDNPTSVQAKNGGKSTSSDYKTDAPELSKSK
ncbi:MAG: LTA synthase family protein [Furfurilactobacillus sp.]|jgi:lipoteichoic acid synthase|uniref:LTA synthase family protein n=1 Tax=Furfurilactobacillus milii TaxID=2888272 RepID=A0ABT6DCQ7_9LACO|nr:MULTISPECIES: LTA synthase family protein [Furfurilactobacillus]QLE66189.1 Lipoteichoic acid synthase LtaS Type IIa [Furfurilactobacillus rossiae]MCF6160714.1 LTA synthase family protein [Furfurilactobacillus milii]MCF6163092.1 LTA synthase family protein [Furfurilactobacillus milii]MCF6420570.1 LTA synthase family protein [Furfurilactobacillus milii]MCH4012704.1 LTA synthase family protein [Furfurilactobacillus sp.]